MRISWAWLVLAVLVLSCNTQPMKVLKPIPDAAYAKGVSAPFCGRIQDVLVVAGGANFPDRPLLEGGAKRVYADIWAYTGRQWLRAGSLPDSTAYGATFTLGDSLILAGGNVSGTTTDHVYQLYLHNGKAVIKKLPNLPVPMEQCGWTQDGETLFLVGQEGVFRCEAGEYRWEKVADLPEPLVQPVAYARGGKFFVWGGYNPETLEVSPRGWCLSEGAWLEAPAIPDDGTFVGATGATLKDGRLVVVGGVNREIFAKALHNTPEDRIPYLSQEPEWYQFRQNIYVFDGERWALAAWAAECALAGPGVAVFPDGLYVAGGELKPGVRSSKIFKLSL